MPLSPYLLLLAAALTPGTVLQSTQGAAITARHGSVYQTAAAGDPSQGFVEIDNQGPADQLTTVTCPIADTTSLVGANGKKITSIPIPAGQNVTLTKSGPHIILQSTHFSIDYGSIIPCSLTFANASPVSVFLYATPAP